MHSLITTAAITAALSLSALSAAEPVIGTPSTTLGKARVELGHDRIVVSTGTIKRAWQWTGKGVVTISLQDQKSGKEWAIKPSHACDWDLPGTLGDATTGVLLGTESRIAHD